MLIRKILEGVQLLHRKPDCIRHRDLKPTNILVDSEGHLRLADFEVSKILEEGISTVSASPIGTENWVAVEILVEAFHGKKGKIQETVRHSSCRNAQLFHSNQKASFWK